MCPGKEISWVQLREIYEESHFPSSWMRVDHVAQVMLREVYKESHSLIPKLMDESGSCSPGYVEGGLQRESFPYSQAHG